jgi:hypothetical protein
MGSFDTPVVVMAFNRPELTKKLMDILAIVQPSTLITICDGPRKDSPTDFEKVSQTRQFLRDVQWECEIIEVFAGSNMGLRNRFISGLDFVFSKFESAIILEDDCHPDLSFFPYCSEILERYKSDDRVSIVSGNNFGGSWHSEFSYRFSHATNIWGWATWSRTWQSFDEFQLKNNWSSAEVNSIRDTFATKGDFKKLAHLMEISENLDTWDVAFSYSCRIKGLVSVVPCVNMVTNLGFGAESTHTIFESYVDEVPPQAMKFPLVHPTDIRVDWRLERDESRSKALRWFRYPLAHPIDAVGRVVRYLLILARRQN